MMREPGDAEQEARACTMICGTAGARRPTTDHDQDDEDREAHPGIDESAARSRSILRRDSPVTMPEHDEMTVRCRRAQKPMMTESWGAIEAAREHVAARLSVPNGNWKDGGFSCR
jgi:hypothetical protein